MSILKDLKKKLILRGLPFRYVNRVYSELTEHFLDLKGEAMSLDFTEEDAEAEAYARLGDIEVLEEGIIEVYRSNSLSCRNPLVAFTLLPLLFACMVFPLLLMTAKSGTLLLSLIGIGQGSEAFTFAARLLVFILNNFSSSLSSIILCIICFRSLNRIGWAVYSCAISSLVSFSYNCSISKIPLTSQSPLLPQSSFASQFALNFNFSISPENLLLVFNPAHNIAFFMPFVAFACVFLFTIIQRKYKSNRI